MEKNALGIKFVSRNLLEQSPEQVAPRLLGKILALQTRKGTGQITLSGRIVEVEAYLGPHCPTPDPAAHAFRGPTPRTRVLFGPAGHAYVYSIYGRYLCMNISCEPAGHAGCVLIRALEPLTGLEQMAANRCLSNSHTAADLTAGPSKLCQALGIKKDLHNGADLLAVDSPLQILDDGQNPGSFHSSPRIGIRVAAHWPLRFVLSDHACASGPAKFNCAPRA